VWLGANSTFKADSDLAKYEKARKLKDYIEDIRKNYTRDWKSDDLRRQQVGSWGGWVCLGRGHNQ
jgi:DNA topoisomerase-1